MLCISRCTELDALTKEAPAPTREQWHVPHLLQLGTILQISVSQIHFTLP